MQSGNSSSWCWRVGGSRPRTGTSSPPPRLPYIRPCCFLWTSTWTLPPHNNKSSQLMSPPRNDSAPSSHPQTTGRSSSTRGMRSGRCRRFDLQPRLQPQTKAKCRGLNSANQLWGHGFACFRLFHVRLTFPARSTSRRR
ncbi:uncharacterized protein V6R79_018464 [Siganus canaliculatus]